MNMFHGIMEAQSQLLYMDQKWWNLRVSDDVKEV